MENLVVLQWFCRWDEGLLNILVDSTLGFGMFDDHAGQKSYSNETNQLMLPEEIGVMLI